MKKRFVLTITLLFAVVAVILAQDDSIKDILVGLGISPTIAVIASAAFLWAIGSFAIPNKWANYLLWFEKLFYGLSVVLHKINEKTNVESKKQKAARLAKKAGIIILLVGMAGAVSAQGFFGPLDKAAKDRAVGDKSKIMLFRPAVTAQGLFIALGEKTPETTAFNGLGLGGSYGLYTEKADGSLYCNFGVQANFWTQFQAGETVDTKMGLSVQAEFVNRFFNIGPAVYFDQGKPKIGIVYGLSYRF